MTWADTIRTARGTLSRAQAGEILCGCPVNTIRDWDQGISEPPKWVQYLVVGQLLRSAAKKPRAKKRNEKLCNSPGSGASPTL